MKAKIKNNTYYNTIAKSYDALYKEEQLKKWNLIKNSIINILKENKVLDIGCGTGIITNEIKKLKCYVIGLDSSKKMLALAKKIRPGPKYILGNAEKLPFGDKSFDVVTSFTMLQDVNDKDKVLSEIQRVCKNYAIISILKRGKTKSEIKKLIKKYFIIKKFIEDEKDFIFLCKPKRIRKI